MKIDDKKIKFVFYLDGNKYIVFSLEDNIDFGDNLYFAREVGGLNIYESVPEDDYEKVLSEYRDYLNCIESGDFDED